MRRGGCHGAFVIYFAYFEVAKVDNPDNDLDLKSVVHQEATDLLP